MAGRRPQSNFTHLKTHDEQLVRLGLLAERYFSEDPNTCLLKLRQLTELLAQWVASRIGLFTSSEEKQVDLLRRLQDQGIVPREVGACLPRCAGQATMPTTAWGANRPGRAFNRAGRANA